MWPLAQQTAAILGLLGETQSSWMGSGMRRGHGWQEGRGLGPPRARAAWDQRPFFSSPRKLRGPRVLVGVRLAVAV